MHTRTRCAVRLIAATLALVVTGSAAAWSWPLGGDVLRGFSFSGDPYAGGLHRGVDVAGGVGDPVLAPVGGTVSYVGTVPTHGRTVTILTEDGYSVTVTHLGETAVAKGSSVAEGERIGSAGSSGTSEHAGTYVHLGVRVAAESEGYVDPMRFLPPRPVPSAPQPVQDPTPATVAAPVPAPVEPSEAPAAAEESPQPAAADATPEGSESAGTSTSTATVGAGSEAPPHDVAVADRSTGADAPRAPEPVGTAAGGAEGAVPSEAAPLPPIIVQPPAAPVPARGQPDPASTSPAASSPPQGQEPAVIALEPGSPAVGQPGGDAPDDVLADGRASTRSGPPLVTGTGSRPDSSLDFAPVDRVATISRSAVRLVGGAPRLEPAPVVAGESRGEHARQGQEDVAAPTIADPGTTEATDGVLAAARSRGDGARMTTGDRTSRTQHLAVRRGVVASRQQRAGQWVGEVTRNGRTGPIGSAVMFAALCGVAVGLALLAPFAARAGGARPGGPKPHTGSPARQAG